MLGDVGKRAFAEGVTAEQVGHDLSQPLERQQLVVFEIDRGALHTRAVLHWSCHFFWKRCTVEMAAMTGFDLGYMFSDLQFWRWDVKNLASFEAFRGLFFQGAFAAQALIHLGG